MNSNVDKTIKKLGLMLATVSASVAVSGCSLILSGTSQEVTLSTNPPGASCDLIREGRIVGSVASTPGAVNLKKTKHDIQVICKKPGYQDATEYLESGTESATFGNIIAGGVVGWAVDSAAGADNKYPEVKTISLVPVEVKTAERTGSTSKTRRQG